MACYDPLSFLKEEVGRFGGNLSRAIEPMSMLYGLIPKGTFPTGSGVNLKKIRYLPNRGGKVTSDYSNMFSAWSTGLGVCADTTACDPPIKRISALAEELGWQPKWQSWRGPDLCHNDLVTKYSLEQQLAAVFETITEFVRDDIEREYYLDIVDQLENTIVVTGSEGSAASGLSFYGNDVPNTCPTCPLLLGVLKQAQINGLRRGFMRGANMSDLGTTNSLPNALLIAGTESVASMVTLALRERAADGYQINVDANSLYSNSGTKLLSKYGIRNIDGIGIAEIPFPRRGTCAVVEGSMVFTPVADHIADDSVDSSCTANSTKVASLVNPDWEDFDTAPVEEAVLLLRRDIFEIQPFPRLLNPGGGARFDTAQNFLGEWEFVNQRDCNENPFGLKGYPQAIHAYAAAPLATYGGFKLYFQRCPVAGSCGPCS